MLLWFLVGIVCFLACLMDLWERHWLNSQQQLSQQWFSSSEWIGKLYEAHRFPDPPMM